MQLTRAADYGTRVMIHLAGLPAGQVVGLTSLAGVTGVSEHFLSKVLQRLCRSGMIFSQRGSGGGFSLAADPERTSLLQVVEAIEGPVALNLCLTDGKSCERRNWCPVHPVWAEAQEAMVAVLRRATIAGIARRPLVGIDRWN